MKKGKLSHQGNVLLLGVVYSEEFVPKRGQEYRDRVRCDALEDLAYDVYTLDDKHDAKSIKSGRHCQANFADCRRMHRLMHEQWGYESFEFIILDYFFSPIGWARERWTDKFFRETLPSFVTENRLKPNGALILPNILSVSEALEKYETLLGTHYSWEFVQNPLDNPLYDATNNCEKELMMMPDMLTNETQVSADKGYGEFPFYALRRKSRRGDKRRASGGSGSGAGNGGNGQGQGQGQGQGPGEGSKRGRTSPRAAA